MRFKPSIYLSGVNIALLSTHQLDASFQREWELFGIPGGIDFFLAFNGVAMSILLVALVKLCAGGPRPFLWKHAIAGTGFFTATIHGVFMALGRPEFTQPSSIVVLLLIFVVSVAQTAVELQAA